MNQSYFPLEAFHPSTQNAITDITGATQAPIPLICTLLIGAMAEAAQGSFDVEIPDFGLSPLTIWTLTIAGSGLGKSPVDRLLRRFIREFERKHSEEAKQHRDHYNAKLLIWKTHRSALLNQISCSEAEEGSLDIWAEKLAQHEAKKPVFPKFPKLSYADATPAAIKQGLAENWPSLTIASDEASVFFSGRMTSAWGMLNQGWDGGRIISDRKDEADSVVIENPRISMSLQVQNGVLPRYIQRRGDEARDLGSWARFLFCEPYNNQGFRFRNGEEISSESLDEFQRRAGKLLEKSIDENGNPVAEKVVLKFNEGARELFFDIHNQIEGGQQHGQWLSQARDYASKATRNIARIAALLHLFEYGPESTEISSDTLNRAATIGYYFINEFLRLFTQPLPVPQIEIDAAELKQWLDSRANADQNRYIMRSDIQRFGPLRLRKAEVLDNILNLLRYRNIIGLWRIGKITYVDLYPIYPCDPNALDAAIRLHRARRTSKKEQAYCN